MQWLWYRRIPRTLLIGAGCLGFLAGLGLAAIGWRSSVVWLVAGASLLLPSGKRLAAIALPAVLMAGVLIGVWRGSEVKLALSAYEPFFGQKVLVHGKVVDDPGFDDKGQLDLRLEHVAINGRKVPGQVRVKSFAPFSPKRGDELQVRGKLYDGFASYQAAIYYGELSIMSHNKSMVEQTRRTFAASVYTAIPEPQASLGLGFLLGLKSELPDDLSNQFKLLGLTHIVVASGYNLTILVRVARRLFQKHSAYQTLVAAFGLMVAFLVVTGFSPSMSRAALVTSLALLAWYYGRRIHPLVLLLLAAAVTAGINPIFLWSDVGWWLSFLAFGGVMLLAPLLQRRIFCDKKPGFLGQLITETISAQVMTMPLIIWLFGDIAVLSLLANILIAPLVPLGMLLTFIGGLAGFLVPASGAYVALPATWLLTYVTDVVGLLSQIPWASMSLSIGTPVMVAGYLVIVLGGIIMWRKTGHDYLSSSLVE